MGYGWFNIKVDYDTTLLPILGPSKRPGGKTQPHEKERHLTEQALAPLEAWKVLNTEDNNGDTVRRAKG